MGVWRIVASDSHVQWEDIGRVHAATLKPRTPSVPLSAYPHRLTASRMQTYAPALLPLQAGQLVRKRRSAVDMDGTVPSGVAQL